MSKEAAAGFGFSLTRIVNRVVGLATTLFLGEWALFGIFRCPFVVPFVSCQNCPVLTCPGQVTRTYYGVWGAIIACVLVCGRSFCGWFCPGGFLQRILALQPFRARIHPDADTVLAYGRYLFLLLCLLAYFFLGQPRVNVPIRIGEFWEATALTFQFAFPMWIFRTGVVLVMLAAALLVSHAFCRYACPMGGLLELMKKISLFSFRRGKECNDCNLCTRACPMQTRPEETNCTNCGDCLTACPRHCIHLGLQWKKDA